MIEAWAALSRRERDAAYNNTEAVPDSAALIEARVAASAAFRASARATLDVPYGPGEREAWDIFHGPDPGAPTLAFIHGGYWQRNRREDFAVLAEGALAMGWNAALCGYTLAPEARLSRICGQVTTALDALAPRLHGPLVLSGWSAGGHLAAMGAAHPAVAAALCISGVYELGPVRDTYLDTALKLTDEEIATLSPLRLPAVMKPHCIAYGAKELPALCQHSRHFHGMRAEAQAPGPLLPIPGADHFRVLDGLRRPGSALLRAAADLLA
ncbi:alpha/beta hydrolase [Roseococcus sp. DSY-14]|uniref:alpha/beta hydrolase n=1 Tax=Roseococcus sp. DSY-14 TaxID=3369650 RepID=UPI00387B27EF